MCKAHWKSEPFSYRGTHDPLGSAIDIKARPENMYYPIQLEITSLYGEPACRLMTPAEARHLGEYLIYCADVMEKAEWTDK